MGNKIFIDRDHNINEICGNCGSLSDKRNERNIKIDQHPFIGIPFKSCKEDAK